jgi:hypothetical protein
MATGPVMDSGPESSSSSALLCHGKPLDVLSEPAVLPQRYCVPRWPVECSLTIERRTGVEKALVNSSLSPTSLKSVDEGLGASKQLVHCHWLVIVIAVIGCMDGVHRFSQ